LAPNRTGKDPIPFKLRFEGGWLDIASAASKSEPERFSKLTTQKGSKQNHIDRSVCLQKKCFQNEPRGWKALIPHTEPLMAGVPNYRDLSAPKPVLRKIDQLNTLLPNRARMLASITRWHEQACRSASPLVTAEHLRNSENQIMKPEARKHPKSKRQAAARRDDDSKQ